MLRLEVSYRGMLLAGLAALSIWGVLRLWPVLLLVITSFIFMAAVLPYIEWLVQRGVRRTVAVLGFFVMLISLIVGLVSLVVPAIVDEVDNIRNELPQDARELEEFLANFGLEVDLEERARNIDWGELISGRVAIDYGQQIFFTTLSIVTIIVLTVYLLIDAPRLQRFLYTFVPAGREPEVECLLILLSRVVGGYIRGQAITSVAIALFTFVVLVAVGVPNPLGFAVLAGFADIIPLIGAFIAIIPPVVAAFHESTTQAVIVLGCLIAYQQFEDRFLVPRVYGQTLNLPPLVVLIAVLSGGQLLGIPGILLSLPATAAGRVFLEYYLEKRRGPNMPLAVSDPLAPDVESDVDKPGLANADLVRAGRGKCQQGHIGSYGYPTRPQEPYQFCSQCGGIMIWGCPNCNAPLPSDMDEAATARFCRKCGKPYFPSPPELSEEIMADGRDEGLEEL